MKCSFLPAAGVAPWALMLLTIIGCSDPTIVQRGDIRTYTAPTAPQRAAPAAAPPSRSSGLALTYAVPEGWTDRGAAGMRLATLTIGPHEVTVIPAAGTLEANVSRWLGQLDPSASPESLTAQTAAVIAAAEEIATTEGEATMVALMEADAPDDREVILGAMIPLDATASLFVKFKGPAGVARREREAFSNFVASMRWMENTAP